MDHSVYSTPGCGRASSVSLVRVVDCIHCTDKVDANNSGADDWRTTDI